MLVAYRSHSLCEIVRQRQRIYDWHAAGQLRPLRLKALSTLLDRFCSKLLMVCQKSLQGWSVVKYVPQQSLFLRFIDNYKSKFVLFVVMQACLFSLDLKCGLCVLNFKVLARFIYFIRICYLVAVLLVFPNNQNTISQRSEPIQPRGPTRGL